MHILPPVLRREHHLGNGEADAQKGAGIQGEAGLLAEIAGEEFGLVEAAFLTAPGMERDGAGEVKGVVRTEAVLDGGGQQVGERPAEGAAAGEFEAENGALKRALIDPWGTRPVDGGTTDEAAVGTLIGAFCRGIKGQAAEAANRRFDEGDSAPAPRTERL